MIDGQPCPSGGIYGAYHVHRIENPHRINGWGGYCKGVGSSAEQRKQKPEHSVRVLIRMPDQISSTSILPGNVVTDCRMGWCICRCGRTIRKKRCQ